VNVMLSITGSETYDGPEDLADRPLHEPELRGEPQLGEVA
jgi:hypothetical protein